MEAILVTQYSSFPSSFLETLGVIDLLLLLLLTFLVFLLSNLQYIINTVTIAIIDSDLLSLLEFFVPFLSSPVPKIHRGREFFLIYPKGPHAGVVVSRETRENFLAQRCVDGCKLTA